MFKSYRMFLKGCKKIGLGQVASIPGFREQAQIRYLKGLDQVSFFEQRFGMLRLHPTGMNDQQPQ